MSRVKSKIDVLLTAALFIFHAILVFTEARMTFEQTVEIPKNRRLIRM
jgi:hypothetical protein